MSTEYRAVVVYGCRVPEGQGDVAESWKGLEYFDSPQGEGVVGISMVLTAACDELRVSKIEGAQRKLNRAISADGRKWPFGKPGLMVCCWSF